MTDYNEIELNFFRPGRAVEKEKIEFSLWDVGGIAAIVILLPFAFKLAFAALG